MDNNRTYYSHKAEVRAARKNTALVVLAFSIGAGLGAVAGLIFAPTSGQKTRDELASSLEHGLEQSVSKGHEMVDPTLKRIEKELVELRKKVEDKVDELR
ncbi:MAG: YtxH domain-containing protein [Anaerolineae bacterium]|nr:YtxH domain-containing protein [Anaerolineae bacterium]